MPIPTASGGSHFARQLDVILADGRTHRESRTHGIVALPRIWLQRAEVRDDAVAQEVGDMPAVLVDGIAHALKVAVEHARQDGRLEPVAHRGGVDEIGEQDGHHFTFGEPPRRFPTSRRRR